MNSNYAFTFRKPLNVAPAVSSPVVSRAPTHVVLRAPAVSRAPPTTNSNRFSINRLINLKPTGGCRSCN